MQKYLIERTAPGAGRLSPEELVGMSQTSCAALREVGVEIQWVQSFVTEDKITCVYLADDAETIRKHAQIAGFPCDHVEPIAAVIDPATADGALWSSAASVAG
jgi:hypothetical protein